MSKEIEKPIDAEDWKAARRLIQAALRKEPDSHWLLTRLGLTYYEERYYRKALFYDTQALELATNCPLVLWDYAGTLDMLGRNKEAIAIYRKLVKRGVDKIAHGECGEGMAWARGVVADCLYRIARCYEEQGQPKKALNYYEQHFKRRGPGCRSIYRIDEVKKEMKEAGMRKDAV
jgi:tetratricopeptide (TPR) repeat protein